MSDYDLIVIGSGPGGYVAAIRAAQNGLKVACAEGRETLGGTCLNVGCIPSKALLHASEFYEEAHSGALEKFGVKLGGVELDWDAMLAEKEQAVKELTGGIEMLFKKNKVDWLKGYASFKDANSVEVDGKSYSADKFIIATGSSVMPLPGAEIDEEVIVSSTGALSLKNVPDSMVVIGGGYIGLELGSVYNRLRTDVTVVEYFDTIVPAMDAEVTKQFTRILKKQGLNLKTATKVVKVERKGDTAEVTVEPAKGGDQEVLTVDTVLVAIGRKANTEGLNLEAAGLSTNERGQVEGDHQGRTAVENIWVIGDVTTGPMLAHKAEDEGIAVADWVAGKTGYVNHEVIPAVVYTHPEVGTVGKTEEELKEAGVTYKAGKFPMGANSRAKTNRDTDGFVKVLADAETDRVLGVHIISSEAGTMIAQAAQAMEFGASSEDIALTCHAHPTHSEAIKEAAMAVEGKPIHA
ncbi:dihydrolipoyl dehydrogenase [Pacificimonas flava]|uniref:Dihydrolipoyl dehydrogenase n=2 Tax=Pacificimonas TaxID=1960290 RepID=A0A219B5S6_9SPHN|nr:MULTISPECIES: dihydrolipoyl dehydrogenase [Pacificimonas]MBZ6379287.1 dihydrolipoyl dehydrogenase [Pacificimonas aurantium]OWV33503.1 dihydrolipoyl dehydrogenase [Pacificimonas flava]